MASLSSQGPSPHSSPYAGDESDESWHYLEYSSGASAAGSVGFLPSPASGSLNGFAIVGHAHTPSQGSMSPLPPSEFDNQLFLPPSTIAGMANDSLVASGFMPSPELAMASNEMFITPEDYLLAGDQFGTQTQQQQNAMVDLSLVNWQSVAEQVNQHPGMAVFQQQGLYGMEQQLQDQMQSPPIDSIQNQEIKQEMSPPQPTMLQWHLGANISEPATTMAQSVPNLTIATPSRYRKVESGSRSSTSPKSEEIKLSPVLPIRKVQSGKVEKKRHSNTSSGSSGSTDSRDNFLVMTPNIISQQAGRANPFECFEAMRPSQKGRKGPLAHATKENALQVRRLGACFCCRSRKVKCDQERPCQHCKRLMTNVPQVVCWQFSDFIPILFPDFMRGHLKKEEVAKFMGDNIDGFIVNGSPYPCAVKLFSGSQFQSTLDLDANFFTAKTCDVLQHWHLKYDQQGSSLQSNGSAPIALETLSGTKREDLRKKVKAYVERVTKEAAFADQVTDSLKTTDLPRKILRIVQRYVSRTDVRSECRNAARHTNKSQSIIAKKALAIYSMKYIMTRDLCLTPETITQLKDSGLVPQNNPWVTPRVLARQVKALVDEAAQKEMTQLFELFTKAMKPKQRSDWAPSLAAFLVLCLYMEAVETMTDNYVLAQNDIQRRGNNKPQFQRSFALNMCKEVENMPFKQFAYQFHNIFQTHSKDASAKPFNPLFDNSFIEQAELDRPAVEMVESLRQLYYGDDCKFPAVQVRHVY